MIWHWHVAIITGRNEVVAKVIFLHLSVNLFTGGFCLSACWDTTPLGADTTTPPEPDPPGPDTPPREQAPSPEADSSIWSTSGRYASYWNAFLFLLKLDC